MTRPTDGDHAQARRNARRAAQRLKWALDMPTLAVDVESLLQERAAGPAARYLDPVGLAALIVAAADLAWTVFHDSRERIGRRALERRTLEQLPEQTGAEPDQLKLIIEFIVDETLPPSGKGDSKNGDKDDEEDDD